MFPYNQPDKTKDCGYRCLYYVVNPDQGYDEWLEGNFRVFQPRESGINFADLCTALNHYGKHYRFAQLSDAGLYIVYSGVWLRPEGKTYGHYFIYHDGVVMCSTHSGPYRMPLVDAAHRLEAKTVEGAFRCLRVNDRA